ncbi:hypothetical protein M513_08607 [Trichuris suis]|uniref:Uncharacterized protein n=1 Tax=Trichuris suis TaxID=68888 RepID=A0A085LZZ3_9BILA|nr:hypothetical protein M513_08607 [Trichuris suis]
MQVVSGRNFELFELVEKFQQDSGSRDLLPMHIAAIVFVHGYPCSLGPSIPVDFKIVVVESYDSLWRMHLKGVSPLLAKLLFFVIPLTGELRFYGAQKAALRRPHIVSSSQ